MYITEWLQCSNLGGTAEVIYSFCPFGGDRSFFYMFIKGKEYRMYPDCDEILKLANDYDIIPVCREIYADVITPITLLRKLSGISSRYYLLESIEGG